MANHAKLSDSSIRTLICGTLYVLVALWFWYHVLGNPLDELALIRRAQIATGSLIDSFEEELEDGRGRVSLSDVGNDSRDRYVPVKRISTTDMLEVTMDSWGNGHRLVVQKRDYSFDSFNLLGDMGAGIDFERTETATALLREQEK